MTSVLCWAALKPPICSPFLQLEAGTLLMVALSIVCRACRKNCNCWATMRANWLYCETPYFRQWRTIRAISMARCLPIPMVNTGLQKRFWKALTGTMLMFNSLLKNRKSFRSRLKTLMRSLTWARWRAIFSLRKWCRAKRWVRSLLRLTRRKRLT